MRLSDWAGQTAIAFILLGCFGVCAGDRTANKEIAFKVAVGESKSCLPQFAVDIPITDKPVGDKNISIGVIEIGFHREGICWNQNQTFAINCVSIARLFGQSINVAYFSANHQSLVDTGGRLSRVASRTPEFGFGRVAGVTTIQALSLFRYTETCLRTTTNDPKAMTTAATVERT
jgi:hypothetical protein